MKDTTVQETWHPIPDKIKRIPRMMMKRKFQSQRATGAPPRGKVTPN
jgi:hypothetical protein